MRNAKLKTENPNKGHENDHKIFSIPYVKPRINENSKTFS